MLKSETVFQKMIYNYSVFFFNQNLMLRGLSFTKKKKLLLIKVLEATYLGSKYYFFHGKNNV